MRFRWALTVLLALTPMPATSQQVMTAGELFEACIIPEEAWISFCNGYVQAAFDSFHDVEEKLCVPEGITRAELAGLVVDTIAASAPSLWDVRGPFAVILAIENRYPCS